MSLRKGGPALRASDEGIGVGYEVILTAMSPGEIISTNTPPEERLSSRALSCCTQPNALAPHEIIRLQSPITSESCRFD